MAHAWQLSDRIWWGNVHWHSEEFTRGARCVLNLADNPDQSHAMRPGQWLRPTPPARFTVPYVWLPLEESTEATGVQAQNLRRVEQTLALVQRENLYPLLIHCWAGQHRSLHAALFAEWDLRVGSDPENARPIAEELWSRIRQLTPHISRHAFGETVCWRINTHISCSGQEPLLFAI